MNFGLFFLLVTFYIMSIIVYNRFTDNYIRELGEIIVSKRKLVIIDGHSLMNRAFYALPPMNNSKDQPTNAVYGFTTMLLKIMNDIKPDYIAAAFDRKAPTFRHVEYQDYKAGRKKMPEELSLQFEPTKEILKAFNIGIFEIDGYEADDVIGTISKKFESKDLEVIIYTGDKDALQLVSEHTKIMITKKGITEVDIYDITSLKEKYGLQPEGITDLKGLMGDSSDNIPGVPGVGEKTALKLLSEFGTIEGIYNNIDKVSGKKLKENLETNKEQAIFSKKLATIDTKVPIDIDLDAINIEGYNIQRLKELFLEYEFKSLIDKVKIDKKESQMNLPDIVYLDNVDELKDMITKKGVFNFVFSYKNGNVEGLIAESNSFVDCGKISDLKEIFENNDIVKNTFNSKPVYSFLAKQGIKLRSLDFDIEIAAYLLNPTESKYGIESILHRYGNTNISNIDSSNEVNVLSVFVNNINTIKESMLKEIEKFNMTELLHKIEMPLIKVLSQMEMEGFKVDKGTLHNIGFELSEEIDKLTNNIFTMAGEEFNINSPKQLGVILFEKLNLPVIKKTKTGYSTDAEVLDELSDKHEIIDNILHYRQLVKLKSTYIDGLISNIADDGKVHSSFNQTVTATGRISSTEPNLQNIPIKMEQGRRIRKAFIPSSDGYLILSADYSQIELRVLAHISSDENLIDAFVNEQDIHKRTASEVFGVHIDEVSSLLRSRAKAINFGIVYGLSDFGLSKDLKISRKEAKQYIDNYFERYSGVKKYLDNAINDAKEKGYVSTLKSRIRHIPEINSTNRNVRLLGERLAMNTPIQGTAADIIKLAMVNVFYRIERENLKSRLILQVHDELVLEVYKNELDYVKSLVKSEMESAIKLSVPLLVDLNVGSDWYETK
jgi:DNA polymerase I